MSSWANNYCGGYGISIKVVNPDGTQCTTDQKKDFDRGETLIWTGVGLGNCSNTVVTNDSTLYIQSDSYDDFCPLKVTIRTSEGLTFITNKIDNWYDYYTNNKAHALKEARGIGKF